jgi:hypothetical protein
VNCREQGFGDCRLLPAAPGAAPRAACATSP